MKKYIIEIVLGILGVTGIWFNDPVAKGIGAFLLVSAVIMFLIRRNDHKQAKTSQQNTQGSKQTSNTSSKPIVQPISNIFTSSVQKEEQEREWQKEKLRKEKEIQTRRDEQIAIIGEETKTKILDIEDIEIFATASLNSDDIDYIANRLSCPLFGGSVQDINDKLTNVTLSDNQILAILKYGTERLRNRFMSEYNNTSWTMSSTVFDYFLSSNRLLLLALPVYSAESFIKLINQLGPYELLGYRTEPREISEQTQGKFRNLFTNTEIPFYEDLDTDVVYIAEQHFSDNENVRKIAFDKVFAGPCDLIYTIKRLDNITEYEATKLFDRQHEDEINEMLERSDGDDLIDYISPKYAIKAVLGIIPSDYSDHIHDNFDFTDVPKTVWYQIIAELTSNELAGYRMKPNEENESPEGYFTDGNEEEGDEGIPYYATGNHDIIGLLEDHTNDNDDYKEIRKVAFDKMVSANNIVDAIESWSNITDHEVQSIMENGSNDEIQALFNREDTSDIPEKLPDEFIIKARLGLFDFGEIDDLNDEYDTRMRDNEEFKAKINKLVEILK